RLAAGRNARPSAGVTRSTEKKLLETTSIATISPRTLVLTKAPRPPCARTPANRVLSPECRGNPETRTEPPAPFSLPVKTDASWSGSSTGSGRRRAASTITTMFGIVDAALLRPLRVGQGLPPAAGAEGPRPQCRTWSYWYRFPAPVRGQPRR